MQLSTLTLATSLLCGSALALYYPPFIAPTGGEINSAGSTYII